jgi:hypothetical protein
MRTSLYGRLGSGDGSTLTASPLRSLTANMLNAREILMLEHLHS